MRPPAEQVLRDYLNRLSVVARTRLPPEDRRAFLARTRDLVERQSGVRDMADPADVMRVLSGIGEPEALVERERTRLEAQRREREAAAGRAGFWKPRQQGGGPGQDRGADGGRTGTGPRSIENLTRKDGRPVRGEIKVTTRPITSRWRPGEPLKEKEKKSRPKRFRARPPASSRRPDRNGSAASGPEAAEQRPSAPAGSGDAGPGGAAPAGPGSAGPPGVTAVGPAGADSAAPAGSAGSTGATGPVSSALAAAGGAWSAGSGTAETGGGAWSAGSGTAETGGGAWSADSGPARAGGAGPAPAGPQAEPSGAAAGTRNGAGTEAAVDGDAAAAGAGGAAAAGTPATPAPTRRLRRPARSQLPRRLQPGDITRDMARMAADAGRQHRREVVCVILLALGGLILLFPLWEVGFLLWLIGALIAVTCKLWSLPDKWLGLVGPLALVIIGTAVVVSLGGTQSTPSGYANEALTTARYLFTIGAVLGAAYLAWRIQRGRRPHSIPPWLWRRHT